VLQIRARVAGAGETGRVDEGRGWRDAGDAVLERSSPSLAKAASDLDSDRAAARARSASANGLVSEAEMKGGAR
jgi:hypothetical protein